MELPLDILISILEHLPASHALDGEESILVLIAFLEANALLREAAKISTIWQPHYLARYHHCNDYEDSQRRSETKGDWRLLYGARRRIDRKALNLLDHIVEQRNGQLDHVAALCSMSFDVWDVLEMEALNRTFYNDPSDSSSVAPHAITRRYWARTILDSIARIYAVNLWDRQQRGDFSVTFVDSFSALSCFSGYSPKYISLIFENLISRCRQHLLDKNCVLLCGEPGYNAVDLCTQICHFMASEGFGAVESHAFHNINNIFPHKYLTTNKKSIPISLVHVFVAVARGLGISASPVDFPQRVLAHISSPDPTADDFYVDVFGAETKMILSLREDIVNLVMRHGIPAQSMAPYISPSLSPPMLLRTSRNILASLNAGIVVADNQPRVPLYLAFTLYLLMTTREQFAARATAYMGLVDCVTVLPQSIAPIFPEGSAVREHLEEKRRSVIQLHSRTIPVSLRSAPENMHVKFHVGTIFQHKTYKYKGCICAWDNVCKQDEKWIREMNVDKLPKGRNQPFYTSFSIDGSERYVAEDNIEPLNASLDMILQFFPVIHNFAVYFSDIETEKTSDRARLVLSPEMQRAFPEDDAGRHHFL
ncbi:hypothetical protein BDZ89DRAFT_1009505 [Hymenopellis radicata]|nr:hypothetical protein BDZ89DRAFT_1009505 [Hymenopellis radicata]